MANPISMEIIDEVGKFGKYEVNIVNWNNRGEVVDIREWYTGQDGNTKPGKGITVKKEGIDTLIKFLEQAKSALS